MTSAFPEPKCSPWNKMLNVFPGASVEYEKVPKVISKERRELVLYLLLTSTSSLHNLRVVK